MNNYQIYEEIGKGQYSIVYKGRKKKTIDYVAIKSVEKSHREKILNEVKILHTLEHPNVLKFHSWYETNNHIWLIVEYCTGGDLLNLLSQDTKMPEQTVQTFGLDLLNGLQYIHSKGILYCDLKPSNVLVEGAGILKLCDFGLAKRLSELNETSAEAGGMKKKRGTPCYMAPELFQSDGVYSFASDFWALGCVLYELAIGHPPFVHKDLEELMNKILCDDYEPVRGVSDNFTSLLSGLLEKDPAKRMSWEAIRRHPFWLDPVPTLKLPDQPHFDRFLRSRGPLDGPEDQLDEIPAREEPHITTTNQQLHELVSSMRTSMNLRRSMSGVDITRISQIVKTNLQRDKNADSYRGLAGDDAPGKRATDQEVDFAEESDRGTSGAVTDDDETSSVDSHTQDRPTHDSDEEGSPHDSDAPSDDGYDSGRRGSARSPASAAQTPTSKPTTPSATSSTSTVASRRLPTAASEHSTPSRPASSTSIRGVSTPSPTPTVPPISLGGAASSSGLASDRSGLATPTPRGQTPRVTLTSDVEQLIYHQSDTHVKPIVGNAKIEKLPEPKFDARSLPFPAHALDDFLSLSKPDLEAFLTAVLKCLTSTTAPEKDKVNALSYFESLCTDAQSANLLINSSLMTMFVKLAKPSPHNAKTPSLQAKLCHVMGLLVRHATFVAPELSDSGIVAALSDLLKDKNGKVKRRAVACLGELLFYIATQQQEPDKPAKSDTWNVPSVTVSLLARCLKTGEDEVVQHFATKTIENVSSHSPEYSRRFCSSEVILSLVQIFTSTRNESLQCSAVSALSRLCRHNPAMAPQIFDKLTLKVVTSSLSGGNKTIQQPMVNIVNVFLLQNTSARTQTAITEDKTFLSILMELLEHSSVIIRGKALISLCLLASMNLKTLVSCCEGKLFSILERLLREKDAYVRECAEALVKCMADNTPVLMAQVAGEMKKLQSSRMGAFQKIAKGYLLNITMVSHAITNPLIRPRAANTSFIKDLWVCIEHLDSLPPTDQSAFKRSLFPIVEALSQHAELLVREHAAVVESFLPAVTTQFDSQSGDTRFLFLKIFTDVVVMYINEPSVYQGVLAEEMHGADNGEPLGSHTREINELLIEHLFPRFSRILDDEDPIPLYGLKLMNNICDQTPDFVVHLHRMGLVPKLFDFFELEHRNNNVHNVGLIQKIVSCEEIQKNVSYDLGLIEKLCAVLRYAHENEVVSFFEPCLDIVNVVLMYTSSVLRRCNEAASQDPKSAQVQELRAYGEAIYQHNEDLLCNLDVYTILLSHTDPSLAVRACHCIVLCAQLYPACHEDVLANLPHLSQVLLENALAALQAPSSDGNSDQVSICKRILKLLCIVLFNSPNRAVHNQQIRKEAELVKAVRALANEQSNPKLAELALDLWDIISKD